jgi:hypothetical protein
MRFLQLVQQSRNRYRGVSDRSWCRQGRLFDLYSHQDINPSGLQLPHTLVRILNSRALDFTHRHTRTHSMPCFFGKQMLNSRVVSELLLSFFPLCCQRAQSGQGGIEMRVVPLVCIYHLLGRRLIAKLVSEPVDAGVQDVNRVLSGQGVGYSNQAMLVSLLDHCLLQLDAGHVELLTHKQSTLMHKLDVIHAFFHSVVDIALRIFRFLELRPEGKFFVYIRVRAVSNDDRHWPPHLHSCSEARRLEIRTVTFFFDLLAELLDIWIPVVHVTDGRDAKPQTLWQGCWIRRIAVDVAVDQTRQDGVAGLGEYGALPWNRTARGLRDLAIFHEYGAGVDSVLAIEDADISQ